MINSEKQDVIKISLHFIKDGLFGGSAAEFFRSYISYRSLSIHHADANNIAHTTVKENTCGDGKQFSTNDGNFVPNGNVLSSINWSGYLLRCKLRHHIESNMWVKYELWFHAAGYDMLETVSGKSCNLVGNHLRYTDPEWLFLTNGRKFND